MSQEAKKSAKSGKIMFLTGALYFLAGGIWIAGRIAGHNTAGMSMGAMWFAIGAMWIAIGVSLQKKEASGKDTREI